MKTLDRSRPFGTIHGFDEGRCFEQDGIPFNAAGVEWTKADADGLPSQELVRQMNLEDDASEAARNAKLETDKKRDQLNAAREKAAAKKEADAKAAAEKAAAKAKAKGKK